MTEPFSQPPLGCFAREQVLERAKNALHLVITGGEVAQRFERLDAHLRRRKLDKCDTSAKDL